jgi:uncharacterized protein YjbJ (UPF0337 family)
MAINAQQLQGEWNQVKSKVEEKWGQLTDDDLRIQGGNVEQLIGRIQQKTGEAREGIAQFLDELTSRGASTTAGVAEGDRDLVEQACGRLQEDSDRVAERASEGYRRGEDLVRSNPGPFIATAFGIRLLVGMGMGRSLGSR